MSHSPRYHENNAEPRLNTNDARAPRQSAIEVIDLSTDSDSDSLVEEVQGPGSPVRQENESEDPRLSHLKCVICLDSPTDLTATTCGHLFCHECISSALRVTSPAAGNCPVCRRKVALKNLIPLAILKAPVLGADVDPPPVVSTTTPVIPTSLESTIPNTRTSTRRKRPANT